MTYLIVCAESTDSQQSNLLRVFAEFDNLSKALAELEHVNKLNPNYEFKLIVELE